MKNHIVITIGREYGSGGRYVGKLVAEKLGINCYDNEFIEKLSKQTGLSKKYIAEHEQKETGTQSFGNIGEQDDLFIKESNLINNLYKKESCVIIGRCSDYILKDKKDVFKVFIYAGEKEKENWAIKYYGLNKKTALKEINKINKKRSKHYKYYTERNWTHPSNYDLMLMIDKIGVEKASDITVDLIKNA